MEAYWTCSDCGSANNYPEILICDVCGKEISVNEKKQAEENLKNAKIEIKSIEKQEKRVQRVLDKQLNLELRREQYEKRKTKNKIVRKQQLLRADKNNKTEKRVLQNYVKVFNGLKRVLVVLIIVSVLTVSVSIIKNNNMEMIIDKIDSMLLNQVESIYDNHIYTDKKGNIVFGPLTNFEKQYKYLEKRLKQSNNIDKLNELLGW